MTHNLWSDGRIPEDYRPSLPDNARFLRIPRKLSFETLLKIAASPFERFDPSRYTKQELGEIVTALKAYCAGMPKNCEEGLRAWCRGFYGGRSA